MKIEYNIHHAGFDPKIVTGEAIGPLAIRRAEFRNWRVEHPASGQRVKDWLNSEAAARHVAGLVLEVDSDPGKWSQLSRADEGPGMKEIFGQEKADAIHAITKHARNFDSEFPPEKGTFAVLDAIARELESEAGYARREADDQETDAKEKETLARKARAEADMALITG